VISRTTPSALRRPVQGGSSPPAAIATAVGELLADPAALREARRFADVIAGFGGGDAAAQKVIRLAGARAQDRALFTA
jgi:hypothetical protein